MAKRFLQDLGREGLPVEKHPKVGGFKSRFILHFTHKDDMDGVGCGVLTRMLEKYGEGDDEIYTSYVIPMGLNERQQLATIEALRNDISGVASHAIPRSFKMSKSKAYFPAIYNEAFGPGGYWPIMGVINIYVCVTDISITEAVRDAIKSLVEDLEIFHGKHMYFKYRGWWQFDHHITNPEYGKKVYVKGPRKDLPTMAIDIEEEASFPIFSDAWKKHANPDKSPIGRTFRKYQFYDKGILRSATFQYLCFLVESGMLRAQIESLCDFVYRVSVADTYTFGPAWDEKMPMQLDPPDAYSLLFKFVRNFEELLNIFDIASPSEPNTIPYVGRFYSDLIRSLVVKRVEEYQRVTRYAKLLKVKVKELDKTFRISFVCEDNVDVSYIGNHICDEVNVDFAVFLFPSSRILSFRSKNVSDSVDVGQIAKLLGGGGHQHAAGATASPELATTLLHSYWQKGITLQQFKNYDVDEVFSWEGIPVEHCSWESILHPCQMDEV